MLYTDLANEFETLWAPVRNLEVVEGEEIVAAQSDAEDDANGGVEGEDGGEDELNVDDEEEGSVGGVTDGEEE
jgi:hypothetical protein